MDKEEIIDEKVFDDLLYESILTVFRINRQRIPGKYEFWKGDVTSHEANKKCQELYIKQKERQRIKSGIVITEEEMDKFMKLKSSGNIYG